MKNKEQEALDNLIKISCPKKVSCRKCSIVKKCNCDAKSYIDILQESIDKMSWVSTNEKLPNDSMKKYLATIQYENSTFIDLLLWNGKYWFTTNDLVELNKFHGKKAKVIAWMKLPERFYEGAQ